MPFAVQPTLVNMGSTGRKAEWLKLHSNVDEETTSSSSCIVINAATSAHKLCNLCIVRLLKFSVTGDNGLRLVCSKQS